MASWWELPRPKTAQELGEYFTDYLAAVDAGREEGHEPAYTSEGEWLPECSHVPAYVPEGWGRRRQDNSHGKSFVPKEEDGA